MAILKDLIVSGVSKFVSDALADKVYANKFIVNNGTSSQFLKADGSLDINAYLTQQDILSKADKVSPVTAGHFAGLDGNGNLTDSGHSHADYVTALGTSGNAVTWTKNGTANSLTVPYATSAGSATTATKLGTTTVGAYNRPIYLNAGVPTATSSYPEAMLTWGGKQWAGSYGCIDAAMVDVLGACRTMFLGASAINVEYSTDAGTTWTDYGETDDHKKMLFSTGGFGFTIGHATAATASANNMLRITINTASAIYTTLNKFVIYISTNGSEGCYCTIRARLQQNYENNVDTWTNFAENVTIAGWSGYNVINTSSLTTYGNTKSSQYGQIQFIFGCTGHSGSTYGGMNVQVIYGFGGVGWTCPSTMARTGHLYSFDASQNATFPANVSAGKIIKSGGTASQFLKADGSVDTNTYLTSADISGKADKVSNSTNGNFAGLNGNGNLTDSGHSHADYVTALGTSGNTVTWTKNGTANSLTVPYATSAGSATSATTATNLASAPSLAASGNNITVTAGGQTSTAFTVPYATSAGSATSATTATNLANNPSIQADTSNANKVTITAGGKTSSAYTIPYATSAGSATSATSATTATNLANNPSIQADTSNANKVTITAGGKTSSAYTIPYATSAGSATSATTATNLASAPSLAASGNNITVTAGGQTSSAFTVPYATSAGTATLVGTAAGSASLPIYIASSGTPTEISSLQLSTGNISTTSGSVTAGASVTAGTSVRASGNDIYAGSASGSQCHMQYDSTYECMVFLFD